MNSSIALGSLSDWVVVAFTGVLTIVAVLQYTLQRRQAAETVDALEISRKSADAAAKAAEVASQSLSATQRAWVIMDRPHVTYYPTDPSAGPHKFADIRAQWVNRGPSPAIAFQQAIGMHVSPEALSDDFDFIADLSSLGPTSILHSGGQLNTGDLVLSFDQYERLQQSASFAYFYGRAIYKSSIDASLHETSFCFRLIPFATSEIGREHVRLVFEPFGQGNNFAD